MEEGATLVNAVIGAVVSAVGSMALPLAPLLGGAIAGYLQGGSQSDGVQVGLISGAIAVVPAALVGLLVFGIVGSFVLGVGPGTDGNGFGLFSLSFFFLSLVGFAFFILASSTVGGWVGNYIKHDMDIDL